MATYDFNNDVTALSKYLTDINTNNTWSKYKRSCSITTTKPTTTSTSIYDTLYGANRSGRMYGSGRTGAGYSTYSSRYYREWNDLISTDGMTQLKTFSIQFGKAHKYKFKLCDQIHHRTKANEYWIKDDALYIIDLLKIDVRISAGKHELLFESENNFSMIKLHMS